MSTNKQAYTRAINKLKSVNYNTVFNKDRITDFELNKLKRFLKPLYIINEDFYVTFRYVKQTQELKLLS